MRDLTDGWIILRCSGPRTLKLAASLQEAGIEAWTPVEHIRRRIPRGKQTEHLIVPITPTYVFARARHLPGLQRMEKRVGTSHPAYSIFRYYQVTVRLAHPALHPLRQLQQSSYLDSLPLAPRRSAKPQGEPYAAGDTVKLKSGAFAGLECTVEASDGATTMLTLTLFGREAGVSMTTRQLRDDGVQGLPIAA